MEFLEAQEKARRNALLDLVGIYDGPSECVLDQEVLGAEHCWMFFQHRSIAVPPERALSKLAYVYGKRGGGRCVPDLRDDREALTAYLQKLSDYFAKNTV